MPVLAASNLRSVRQFILARYCTAAPHSAVLRALVILCGLSVGWLSAALPLAAQEAGARPRLAIYDRTEHCLTCHSNLKSGTDFVTNMSAQSWQDEDKHSRAFTLLETQAPLTHRILGFPLADVVRDGQLRADVDDREKLALVVQCLRCHSTWPKEEQEPPVELRLGVSCQACHGPGFHWSQPHREKWWRMSSTAEKERLGMRNLRSSTVKAALCASCHVGSAAEDRQVTHAMYAAGHPPLPGFELTAFAAQLPAHWRTLGEKGAFAGSTANPYTLTAQDRKRLGQLIDPAAIKENYVVAHYPDHAHDPTVDSTTTKEILAGGVAALKRYLELVAASARQRQDDSAAWPDFALYDCRACHHELRPRTTAASIGFAAAPPLPRRGPPGRPPARQWTWVLARAAAAHGLEMGDRSAPTGLAEFDRRMSAFERALTDRPFGDPAETLRTATEFSDWLDELSKQLERARYDDAASRRLARFLVADATLGGGWRASDDYHAARQAAWALESLAADSPWRLANLEPLGPLPRRFQEGAAGDPLRLRLPAGTQASVVEELRLAFEAPNRFDPVWFRARLRTLQDEISKFAD